MTERRKQQGVINLLMRLSVWGEAILSCALKVPWGRSQKNSGTLGRKSRELSRATEKASVVLSWFDSLYQKCIYRFNWLTEFNSLLKYTKDLQFIKN